ncbi:MAG: OsmC family peroxiredoxin [Sphingobacteriales bacterium]|nr:MAG: OsmC family peroxiredoxin [Sphingobacteriales bacterium]
MPTVTIIRTNAAYGFTATDADGQVIRMDTSPEGDGHQTGVRPMQTLLMALGGCSGIDVVSILQKQRQSLQMLEIQITGEREPEGLPALWKMIHMRFRMGGDLVTQKARHAVQLSVEKYCSVAETLRRAGCVITWEVDIREASVPEPTI